MGDTIVINGEPCLINYMTEDQVALVLRTAPTLVHDTKVLAGFGAALTLIMIVCAMSASFFENLAAWGLRPLGPFLVIGFIVAGAIYTISRVRLGQHYQMIHARISFECKVRHVMRAL